jgi:hypothetical protein
MPEPPGASSSHKGRARGSSSGGYVLSPYKHMANPGEQGAGQVLPGVTACTSSITLTCGYNSIPCAGIAKELALDVPAKYRCNGCLPVCLLRWMICVNPTVNAPSGRLPCIPCMWQASTHSNL